MDEESKDCIYRFFSSLTRDELINVLKDFYDVANDDGIHGEYDFEDSIKWMAFE